MSPIAKIRVLDEVKNAYADRWMPWEEAVKVRNLAFRASAALPTRDPMLRDALGVIGVYNAFDQEDGSIRLWWD